MYASNFLLKDVTESVCIIPSGNASQIIETHVKLHIPCDL